jgi:hypothetical protein
MASVRLGTAALALAGAMTACGGSESPIGTADASTGADAAGPTADGAMTADGGPGLPDALFDANNPPACPSSADAATGQCAPVGEACNYPQGSCDCEWVQWCGGTPPPPGYDAGATWACVLQRTDGCPDAVPQMGAPCNSAGKQCRYGSCCMQTATCNNGTWSVGPLLCPA